MRETGKNGLQDRCVKWARSRKWYARKFKSPSNNAVPDYVFAMETPRFTSVVVFVEFKAPGKTPTELQLWEHTIMRKAGLHVEVFDDIEKFQACLTALEQT